jgi:hypothetical protein
MRAFRTVGCHHDLIFFFLIFRPRLPSENEKKPFYFRPNRTYINTRLHALIGPPINIFALIRAHKLGDCTVARNGSHVTF